MILYILLCGYPPFNGSNDEQIIKKVKEGKYRTDEEEWENISVDAIDIINKLLQYEPHNRISAAEALQLNDELFLRFRHLTAQTSQTKFPLIVRGFHTLGGLDLPLRRHQAEGALQLVPGRQLHLCCGVDGVGGKVGSSEQHVEGESLKPES